MKRSIIASFTVFALGFMLTGCGSKQYGHMGSTVDTGLEKNDNGNYIQKQAEYFTDSKNKITTIKFAYEKNSAAVSEESAKDDMKKATSDDLKHVSGNKYYSKKENKYYTVQKQQQSDGRITNMSIFLEK